MEADPDPKEAEARVRHLAKYVFPRQYGLSHPFVEHERGFFQSHKSPDYSNREEEIKVEWLASFEDFRMTICVPEGRLSEDTEEGEVCVAHYRQTALETQEMQIQSTAGSGLLF